MSTCHIVKFYWDESDLIGSLADYAAEVLDRGDYVQALIREREWEKMRERLIDNGSNVEQALETGQLEFVDATSLRRQLTPEGPPSRERFDEVAGQQLTEKREKWPNVHVLAQLVDLMVRDGDFEEAERVEHLVGELCDEDMQVTCSFDLRTFDNPEEAEAFQEIIKLHQRVLPAGESRDAEAIADIQRETVTLSEKIRRQAESEEKLEAVVDYQEQLNRRKDEFLAMLAHELRNPMGAILHALDLMEVRGSPATEREREIIKRQISHMERLVDELLDVSRVTRGELELDRKHLLLTQVVDRAIETCRSTIEEHDQQLHVDKPDTSPKVEGDFDRMVQVVSNLLTNAAQYNDPGGNIWIEVEARPESAIIRVRDDGRGIEPKALPRIFDLFYQREEVTESGGGLGIGLPLAKKIVELHDGSIEASSEGLGRGSEFVVELPRADTDGESTETSEADESTVARPTPILLVDDNHDLADTLAESLEHLGHEVQVAYDAESALEIVEQFDPEVAFLDLNLPGMSGYELVECIRERSEKEDPTDIVALSGYGDEASRQRSFDAGFDAHLVKPMSMDALQEVIDRAQSPE